MVTMTTFEQNPDLLRFKIYTSKLKREFSAYDDERKMKECINWDKGVKKMKQIAMGYGIDFQPDRSWFTNWIKKKYEVPF